MCSIAKHTFLQCKPCGSWLTDQNNILHILINKSITAWLTEILMPFVSFSGNMLQDALDICQKSGDNFETTHERCLILVWNAVSP